MEDSTCNCNSGCFLLRLAAGAGLSMDIAAILNVTMTDNPLGKTTHYESRYDPSLLFPIPRAQGRGDAGLAPQLLVGYDRWICYELSWLSPTGKPEVRALRLVYSADSTNIVESKSLKLYLGSFMMSRFDSEQSVIATIRSDLLGILETPWLDVHLYNPGYLPAISSFDSSWLVDDIAVSCAHYQPDAGLLITEAQPALTVTLCSHVLKTNCPITGQPDWASVRIDYQGPFTLDRASFLRYLVSYREHGGYHEACGEQIFSDLLRVLHPQFLTVKCFFTRRGGIDITPCRFFGVPSDTDWDLRYWRQ